MGQKINPVSLRLQYTNRHFENCWYSNYFYQNLITRDIFLQQYLNNFLKLLKFDAGRYSIQHLQKNTQIFNFFCYSKSTREWRSKIFGLVKKKSGLKKARYFVKTAPIKKKRVKKGVKLLYLYRNLNQIAVQRIKKKITSFQNLKLWSTLLKIKPRVFSFQKTNEITKTHSLSAFNVKKNQIKPFRTHSNLNQIEGSFKQKSQLLKKLDFSIDNSKRSRKNLPFQVENPISNLNQVFLHNLLVYKILKSHSLDFQNKNLGQASLLGFNQKSNTKYKNYLENFLSSLHKTPINLLHFKVKNDWQNAHYLADEIVYFLEKRVSFRAIKSKILKPLLKNPQIRGIRITCSGRVGGKSKKAQRAKTECIKYGQTSLQVFSSKLDFAVKTAFTSFGSVGVKVWICYN